MTMTWMLLMAAVGPSAAEISALETSALAGQAVRTRTRGHPFDLGPRVQARNVKCVEQARGRVACAFESRQSNGPYKSDFGAWTPRNEILVRDGLGGWRIEPAKAGP
jgi:hypothetical protein